MKKKINCNTKNFYTIGNEDNLEKALEGLGQFCHNWCMNCKETIDKDEPIFRCKQCDFENENGTCQIKIFLNNYTSGNSGKYTCMGDL